MMRQILIMALGMLFISGCSATPKADSFSFSNPFSKKDKVPEPYPNPVKMAVTWVPDTLTTPGKTTTRGFGGRVFFYNDKSQAVPVDGELTITAYEQGMPGQPPTARRFGFTKEQFTKHFSQSDLGASYSIWVPWDADGGLGQRITLVAAFQPVEGNAIQGSPTAVLLPGPMPEQQIVEGLTQRVRHRVRGVPPNAQPVHVRQAGYDNQLPSPVTTTQSSGGMTTTTIPMGGDLSRYMSR